MASRRAVRGGLVFLGVALVASGIVYSCLPERVELSVGAHRISVLRPGGFEVVPNDDAFLFRNGPILVQLEDLGAPGGDPGPEAPLDEWVDWGLRNLDSSRQREVARRGALPVQDRELRVVETWDHLTHGQRRRFAFVRNEGSLLVLHTRGGDYGRAASAFDRVLQGFEFIDPEPESGH